ncbi:hypothetical protein JAAARDRAFT_59114 [Jaapia argillacea MUCL 33604]|uniref:non-specific serine/threonine protein kinase n=1 Tax=Jaapia argillacea MUCL 33604 TaxID=933084 RepID=A0A067Q2S9_9AGAM|nr:hypothetical protein JAAARDRAFT_59114 [Jaapia argillacea MUCL 33604]
MAILQRLSTLLLSLSLATRSLTEPIALTGQAITDRITELSPRDLNHHGEYYRFAPPLAGSASHAGYSEDRDELKLMDMVLVASVDGNFHALNRTSGAVLWSMSSSSTPSPGFVPASLQPLVRTRHNPSSRDSDSSFPYDQDPDQEQYIIEPQSGSIYVLQSPSSSLVRLPFSMPELVDMSPFTLAGDDERRVFVGKKETTLMLVELETGRVKGALNWECPWDGPIEEELDVELDLDELEDEEREGRKVSKPTEIYIGRTDYHISIYTRPLSGSSSSFSKSTNIQNLSFSTYGPNNQDNVLQSTYHRTPDDLYLQSLPDGKVISFNIRDSDGQQNYTPGHARGKDKGKKESESVWGCAFDSPIVAIFDVLTSRHRAHPFVLLQPRPRLQDVFPRYDLPDQTKLDLQSAYVGLVGGGVAGHGGSLFAMSPENFPLIVFGDGSLSGNPRRGIDPPRTDEEQGEEEEEEEEELPLDVDSVTKYREMRKLRKMCRDGRGDGDPRCLVGLRALAGGQDSQGRTRRLLEGVPSVEVPPILPPTTGNYQNAGTVDEEGGGVGLPTHPTGEQADATPTLKVPPPKVSWNVGGSGVYLDLNWGLALGGVEKPIGSVLLCLLLLFAGAWVVWWKRGMGGRREDVRPVSSRPAEVVSAGSTAQEATEEKVLEDVGVPPLPPIVGLDEGSGLPPVTQPLVSVSSVELPEHAVALDRPQPNGQPTTPLELPTSPPPPPLPQQQQQQPEDAAEGEESDREGDVVTPGNKRKAMRRKRGRKKKGVTANTGSDDVEGTGSSKDWVKVEADAGSKEENVVAGGEGVETRDQVVDGLTLPPVKAEPKGSSLVVSDEVLGFGSHGTVVFKGSLQGRAVAVKRLLQDFVTLASREVSILQESDDHPNVIRYYYQESHSNFLYIALELCPASLADIVERPDQFRDISVAFDPKRALREITAGLRHLHALKIVHRDIKPQNILISSAKKGSGKVAGHRMMISDFGLCKKLEFDQTSFLPTAGGAMAVGTVGWRAPEILRGEVKLDESVGDDQSQSSRSSTGTVSGIAPAGKPTRLTKSVDIFALGCVFYYVLTNGGHPFGDRFEREVNIIKDIKSLDGLERFGEEGSEAVDLIGHMLDPEASQRPDTRTCLLHPFFWDPGRRLTFLQDASDRFEIMCRDPRDPHLILLEALAPAVVGVDWVARLDKTFVENLGKFRKYDGRSVQDLMRALRNKKHHYQDLPDNVKRTLGSMPEGFLSYFTRRFPRLFLHVHSVISNSSLRQESMFRSYFDLSD